jgi:hypothetical protein
MSRSAPFCFLALLMSGLMLLLALNACGAGPLTIPVGKIRHIVIIVQENRSPDNLFHDPVLMARGADIANSGKNAKPAHISHVNHDFGSILNFVEQTFRLHSLDYADTRADNLSDCFDFSQSALQFNSIEAPLKADYFLKDTRIPEDPDSD